MKVVFGEAAPGKLPAIPLEEIVKNALEQQRKRKVKQVGESCIHSRNIIALLDLSERTKEFRSFTTHLENCFECQDQLAKTRNLQNIIDTNIPVFSPDEEALLTFKSELNDLFKNLIIRPPSKAQTSLKFGVQVIDDLVATVLQPKMLVLFGASILVGALIKYFS